MLTQFWNIKRKHERINASWRDIQESSACWFQSISSSGTSICRWLYYCIILCYMVDIIYYIYQISYIVYQILYTYILYSILSILLNIIYIKIICMYTHYIYISKKHVLYVPRSNYMMLLGPGRSPDFGEI